MATSDTHTVAHMDLEWRIGPVAQAFARAFS